MGDKAPTPSRKTLLALVVIPLLAMAGAWILLSALNGPTDDGFRCSRPGAGDAGACQILSSRFLGLAGNSAVTVPGSAVRGAKSVCGTAQVGRANVTCRVYLVMDPGGEALVLSYPLESQAEAAVRRINAYLADPSAPALEIRDSALMTVLVYLGAPLLLVSLVALAGRWWRLSRR
jgi:hypothetical protein